MGLLLSALANCGSRKPDGTANASGKVFLYSAGTTQQEFGYADAGCTVPLTAPGGAISLDGAGKRTIYMKAPADLVITDVAGAPVDNIPAFDNHRAELVEVQHASFTGALTDPGTGAVSQALGGLTSLQAILTSAAASLGPNFQYLLPGGTARNVSSWMQNVGIFAGDFGAKFDGKTDDTTAIQKAINYVASLGGGVVLLPPGTSIIGTGGSGLTITHAGTVIQGAGQGVTTLSNASGALNSITFTGANSVAIRGLRVTSASANTGTGLVFSNCTGVQVTDVKIDTHQICMSTASSTSQVFLGLNNNFQANSGVAAARALSISATTYLTIVGGLYQGSSTTYGAEFFGTCDGLVISGVFFSGAGSNAVRLDTTFAASGTKAIGNRTTCTAFWSFGNSTDPGDFYEYGNGSDTQYIGILSGAHGTVDRSKGSFVKFNATTTGSAYLIDPPTPTPTRANTPLTLQFYNHAGGAVTGWTLDGTAYKTAASIPTTDAHVITVTFAWDSQQNFWRETSRADTAV